MTNAHDYARPINDATGAVFANGLTAIEHAALVTGQPCSGTPWLDEMLAKARCERLAGQALASINFDDAPRGKVAQWACEIADALIAALEGDEK